MGQLFSILLHSNQSSATDVSPDGRFVSAVRSHNLWLGALAGSRLRPLTSSGNSNLLVGETDPVYAAEFGADRHYWWSPDSSAIAFIETEFTKEDHYPKPGGDLPKFRLKVLDVKSGVVRTVSESNEAWPYILRVVWHPDSRRIAFYRLNRSQNEAQLCLVDGDYLQIVLTERDLYWVNPPLQPLFLPDGKSVVVSSERSGASHLYMYSLTGEMIRDLTPPDTEVYQLHPSMDARNRIYATASQGDKQEQHLFRIDVQSGEWTKLTIEPGWHETILDDSATGFLDRFSSAQKAPSIWWGGEVGEPRQLLAASTEPTTATTEFLPIRLHDGTSLPARLFRPAGFNAQTKYPVIVYTSQGPQGRVVSDSWGGWQMEWNRSMAAHGYLIMAVDTRGSSGYGHTFEEYLHFRFGAQETVDLREVVDFLRRQTYVDPQRIGIWGCGFGAHTVVHAMLEFPNGFKAGFAYSPIVDWTEYDAYFAERYLGLPRQHSTDYQDSSPLDSARRITGTLLVAPSRDDARIQPAQIEALKDAFSKVSTKRPATAANLRVLSLASADNQPPSEGLPSLLAAMKDFFDKTL